VGKERVLAIRPAGLWDVAPAEIIMMTPRKQWRYGGHPYLSGEIKASRLDIPALGGSKGPRRSLFVCSGSILMTTRVCAFCWARSERERFGMASREATFVMRKAEDRPAEQKGQETIHPHVHKGKTTGKRT
jgi:hypothetical protein